MNEAGYTGNKIAKQLGWSPSRVSRLLSGKRGGSEADVAAFVSVCGVKSPERDRLVNLSTDQHRTGLIEPHLPTQLRTLINHEKKAVAISNFEFNLIPGLLQTDAYIRSILNENGRVPAEEIDDRVCAKLGRKTVLGHSNRRFRFYLHEFALRLPVGGKGVMSEQLHALLGMSVRPNIKILVVPTSMGAHAATAGSFILMEFNDIRPIVYLDSETSGIFLELPIEIRAYRSVLAAIAAKALPEGQSREFISQTALELYAEDQDDLAEEHLQCQRQRLC